MMLPTLTPPIVRDSIQHLSFCVTSWDVPWYIHSVCHEEWNSPAEYLWKASSVRSFATLAVEILPKNRLTSSISCFPKWRSTITSQSSRCIYESRFTVHFASVSFWSDVSFTACKLFMRDVRVLLQRFMPSFLYWRLLDIYDNPRPFRYCLLRFPHFLPLNYHDFSTHLWLHVFFFFTLYPVIF